MRPLMLRYPAIAMILLPVLVLGQAKPNAQPDKGKVLDAVAKTPFFTQKGADAVKRVIAGGQARFVDEKLLDPAQKQGPTPQQPGLPAPNQLPQTQPAAPPPERPFAWRLVGISYGVHRGMALFQADGKNKTVCPGTDLDSDTKILSVDRRHVTLLFHGKRIELSPW